MKKLIRYRLSISRTFPVTHKRKGEETFFVEKIEANSCVGCGAGMCDICCSRHYQDVPKLHTIRGNYDLWKKRFEKINKGEAVLELYYWSGSLIILNVSLFVS